jgi:hypothetical protein
VDEGLERVDDRPSLHAQHGHLEERVTRGVGARHLAVDEGEGAPRVGRVPGITRGWVVGEDHAEDAQGSATREAVARAVWAAAVDDGSMQKA